MPSFVLLNQNTTHTKNTESLISYAVRLKTKNIRITYHSFLLLPRFLLYTCFLVSFICRNHCNFEKHFLKNENRTILVNILGVTFFIFTNMHPCTTNLKKSFQLIYTLFNSIQLQVEQQPNGTTEVAKSIV